VVSSLCVLLFSLNIF